MNGRIAWLDSFEITLPLPKPLRLGDIQIPHREYSVVRIGDDEGRIGTAYALSRNAPIALMARKTIAPLWQGHSIEQHQRLYDHAVSANVCLGTNGPFWRALSLADCALYDLLAQRANVSLAAYLGGGPKRIPTVLVNGYPSTDETEQSLGDQMVAMAARSPVGVKIAAGDDHRHDTRRLRACRAAIPNGPPLAIDLHWSGGSAAELLPEAEQWAELRMAWLEDPFAFDAFTDLAALADTLPYPVAVGDEQSGVRHFTHLMDYGHVDIVRLDPTVCGGVRAFMTIAGEAQKRGRPVACHGSHWLNSQLAAAHPNVQWIEHLPPALEPTNELFESELTWEPGGFVASSEPGVGYDWDESTLDHFRNKD